MYERICSCGHCGTCLNEEIREIKKLVKKLLVLTQGEILEMAALDDAITALQAEVSNDTNVISAADTLINGISAQITAAVNAALAAGATPAQLAALTAVTTTLAANDTSLAAAVAANTPVSTVGPTTPASAVQAAVVKK
jgi:hypothetical protein